MLTKKMREKKAITIYFCEALIAISFYFFFSLSVLSIEHRALFILGI